MNGQSLLLDSNILIWLDKNPSRIPPNIVELLENTEHVYVSAASAWELGIKQAQRRFALARSVSDLILAMRFLELPVSVRHAEAAGKLPLHHQDPFDRLLVAQAISERFVLVTSDKLLLKYGTPIILV